MLTCAYVYFTLAFFPTRGAQEEHPQPFDYGQIGIFTAGKVIIYRVRKYTRAVHWCTCTQVENDCVGG